MEEEAPLQEEFDDGKLTLGDLFSSLDKAKMRESVSDVVNTNKLQKHIKALRKDAQETGLIAPLNGRKRLTSDEYAAKKVAEFEAAGGKFDDEN